MLKSLIRPAMIFIPLTFGFFFPVAGGLTFLIRYFIATMLYLVFLKLRLNDLPIRRTHFYLLGWNLAYGVLPYLILNAFGMRQLALAAFFTGIAPTANAAPVIINFLRGNVGFVVGGVLVTTAGVSLALPLLLPMVTGNYSFAFVGKVAESLFWVIVFPALLAIATRKLYPPAEKWPAKLQNFSFTLWSLCLLIVASDTALFLRRNPDTPHDILWQIAGLSLGLCALNFGTGYLVAPRKFRRESSQTLGQKNTNFTLYLALAFVNPLAAMGPIFYILWHNSYNALQMFLLERRLKNRTKLP